MSKYLLQCFCSRRSGCSSARHARDTIARLTLLLCALAMGMGQTTLLGAMPLLMSHSGLALTEVTISFAIGSALFLVGAPLWSFVGSRWGSKLVVGQALAGFVVSHTVLLWQLYAGPALDHQDLWLLGGRALYGLSCAALIPTAQAWLCELDTTNSRLASVSRIAAAMTLGRFLGPALGAISTAWSTLGPFWIVTLVGWPPVIGLIACKPPPEAAKPMSSLSSNSGSIRVWPLLLVATLTQFTLGSVHYGIGPWLGTTLQLNDIDASIHLSWLLSGTTLVMLFTQVCVLPRCRPERWLLSWASGLLMLAGSLMALANSAAEVWAGVLMTGVCCATLGPIYTALLSTRTAARHNTHGTSAVSVCHTLGFGLSGLAVGWVMPLGPSMVFVGVAASGLFMLLLTWLDHS